jgi:hypothetical protein
MVYVVLKRIETSDTSDGDLPKFIVVGKDRLDALQKILGPVEPIAELKGAQPIHLFFLPPTQLLTFERQR